MAISMANQKVPAWACVVLGVWCLAATLKIMLPQSGAGHEGAVGLVAGPRARVPPHQPDSASSRDSTASALPPWALDERNVRIPRDETGAVLPSAERLRLLELKLGGVSNWAKDPWFGQRVSSAAVCKKESDLAEFGCPPKQACPGLYSHKVCLDNLPRPAPYGKRAPLRPDCVVYDFGIRAQPEFGLIMAESFGCTVHAFDPSPVTTQWFKANTEENAQKLHKLPNYHMHAYGGGGIDGEVELGTYDWGQVSILRYPPYTVDCVEERKRFEAAKANAKAAGHGPPNPFSFRCKIVPSHQAKTPLPVKTLKTVMAELGHTRLDVLKLDIEGSEFAFLEQAIDTSSLWGVAQLTLEWHHFTTDPRYGTGSSPSINALQTALSAMGLEVMSVNYFGGWPSDVLAFDQQKLELWYNVISLIRPRQ
eukprot:m.165644 g.165644  ORF g.165644 m.165644 type:complete len:422 (-) comp24007_c1_seq1:318-1583(-)